MRKASTLTMAAIHELEDVPHEDTDVWEAKMSLLNAIANLKRARGE